MNAVRGAHVYAEEVFDAGVGNHIGHDGIVLEMNWSLPTPPEVEAIEEWLSGTVMEGRKWCPYITLRCDGDHSRMWVSAVKRWATRRNVLTPELPGPPPDPNAATKSGGPGIFSRHSHQTFPRTKRQITRVRPTRRFARHTSCDSQITPKPYRNQLLTVWRESCQWIGVGQQTAR